MRMFNGKFTDSMYKTTIWLCVFTVLLPFGAGRRCWRPRRMLKAFALFHFTWFVVLTSGFGHWSTELMVKNADLLHSLHQRFLRSVATLGPLVLQPDPKVR
uniref:Uncharacterized protein n=1 Tax=Anopheles darlingi TaxID=43151 RepID=A0A2M4DMA8_ANODA